MAGYRPKSLDELNDMYDKTIIAEKAILSATKQLNNVTETIAPSDSTAEADAEIAIREDAKTVEEFSSEVDSMINRFKEANAGKEVKPLTMAEPTPFIEEPVSEPEEEISFETKSSAFTIAIGEIFDLNNSSFAFLYSFIDAKKSKWSCVRLLKIVATNRIPSVFLK